jgi:hypothetical protein
MLALLSRVHVAQHHMQHLPGARLGRGDSIRETACQAGVEAQSPLRLSMGVTGTGMLRTDDQGPDRVMLEHKRYANYCIPPFLLA